MKQNEDCTIGMDSGLRNTKEIKKWAKECGRSGGTVHYLPLRKPEPDEEASSLAKLSVKCSRIPVMCYRTIPINYHMFIVFSLSYLMF